MITLNPARTAELFTALEAQQRQFPSEQHPVPLPYCPACSLRPDTITLRADGQRITFAGCGHVFELTRSALIAGLAAQRAA
jgi:hypothetical protein